MTPRERFEELLDRYVDGALSSADSQEWDDLLRSEPEWAIEAEEELALVSMLRSAPKATAPANLLSSSIAKSRVEPVATSTVAIQDLKQPSKSGGAWIKFAQVAAVFLIIGGSWVAWQTSKDDSAFSPPDSGLEIFTPQSSEQFDSPVSTFDDELPSAPEPSDDASTNDEIGSLVEMKEREDVAPTGGFATRLESALDAPEEKVTKKVPDSESGRDSLASKPVEPANRPVRQQAESTPPGAAQPTESPSRAPRPAAQSPKPNASVDDDFASSAVAEESRVLSESHRNEGTDSTFSIGNGFMRADSAAQKSESADSRGRAHRSMAIGSESTKPHVFSAEEVNQIIENTASRKLLDTVWLEAANSVLNGTGSPRQENATSGVRYLVLETDRTRALPHSATMRAKLPGGVSHVVLPYRLAASPSQQRSAKESTDSPLSELNKFFEGRGARILRTDDYSDALDFQQRLIRGNATESAFMVYEFRNPTVAESAVSDLRNSELIGLSIIQGGMLDIVYNVTSQTRVVIPIRRAR